MWRQIDIDALRELRRDLIRERLAVRRIMEVDVELPLPTEPTAFWCGSRQKIEVMRLKAERGESLFHPLDADSKMVRRDRYSLE